jgi:hypothetical protein
MNRRCPQRATWRVPVIDSSSRAGRPYRVQPGRSGHKVYGIASGEQAHAAVLLQPRREELSKVPQPQKWLATTLECRAGQFCYTLSLMRASGLTAAVALALSMSASAQSTSPAPADPDAVLDRIADHVRRYYSRAQSLVGLETVSLQPVARDFSADGHARRLVYQMRLEWIPPENGEAPAATMMRELITVDGRRPRPKDKPKCSDPRESWDEPLAMFLPELRHTYQFKWAGLGKTDGRPTVSLEFREKPVKPVESPEAEWIHGEQEECVSVAVPGRTRGRVWADVETGEVLRLDQSIAGFVDLRVPSAEQNHWQASFLTLERSDTSIKYRRVNFSDPDEALMLPASIDTLTVWRGGNTQPIRRTQTFAEYRRFVTGGRLVD